MEGGIGRLLGKPRKGEIFFLEEGEGSLLEISCPLGALTHPRPRQDSFIWLPGTEE